MAPRQALAPAAALIALAGAHPSLAQPATTFTDNTPPVLLTYEMAKGMVGGAAAADYDNDGDIDVFLPNHLSRPSQLLQNQGDGTLVDVATTCGLGALHNDRAALWFDYDNDQDLDLVVVADNHFQTPQAETTSLRLYQNRLGQFTDVTQEAGLFAMLENPNDPDWGALCHASGMCVADFNNDGALDLYVNFWRGHNHLFLNNADGSFANASQASGIHAWSNHWTPAAHDFDRDGDIDIFQAIDFIENKYFDNNGDATFTEMAATLGIESAWNEMGVALGDPDNDGDIDIFVTNISDYFQSQGDYVGRYNVYFRNDSIDNGPGRPHTLVFTENAQPAGFARGGWGWGCTFADLNNDRWQDLAQTNGFDVPPPKGFDKDPSHLWINQGDGTLFADQARDSGTDDNDIGACYIAFDANRDGDLDLLQTCKFAPARLLTNNFEDTQNNHDWLVVRPRGVTPGSSGHTNHHAIGALVRATVHTIVPGETVTMTRLITAGSSTLGQEPAEAHFGLGSLAADGFNTVANVTIEWPNGATTSVNDLPLNQVVTLVDATAPNADLNHDGVIDIDDLYRAHQRTFDLTGDLIHNRKDILAVETAVRASEAE
ncbi:MAG: CRTAC1 family protein [Planctomycetota bacterium]